MEINLESLSPDEFFGTVNMHSQIPETGTVINSNGIGNIVTGLIIGGFLGYIFRKDIKALFNWLFGNNTEESI